MTSGRRRAGDAPTDPGFPALKARVIARTGHHYYADKDDLLIDRLVRRFRARNVADSATYAAVLDGPDGPAEWSALESEITIAETFFFRYAEQFAALRTQILPDLIAARRSERRLRIWSAGCSTGAEPYSIAILLHDLLGAERAGWDLSILGTDISVAALATARAAEYGRWALRTTSPQDRLRWFQRTPPRPGATREGGYRLRPEFRTVVRFERQNLMGLIDGSFPPAHAGFDLILCRNVLIYFSAEHVLGMIAGFAQRLRPGGWLLIGHAEPNPAFETWLAPVALPGTAAYRRRDEPLSAPRPTSGLIQEAATLAGPALALSEPPSGVPDIPPPGAEPVTDTAAAADEPADLPADAPTLADLAAIRALADAGRTGEAWRLLRTALDANPADAALRFYEGILALGLGREMEAERALRGALYLERDFVMAHFHLGLLLAALGRRAAAARALDNALRLAQGRSPETRLREGDGVTAGELVVNARRALDALGLDLGPAAP